MDKVFLIFGLLVAVAVIATGGFGIVKEGTLGFNFLSPGPRASGPGGGFWGSSPAGVKEPAPAGGTGYEPPAPVLKPESGISGFRGSVKISSVSGAAYGGIRDQYVRIYNTGNKKGPIYIHNWSLANTQGKRYLLGEGALIPLVSDKSVVKFEPNQEAFIHTGSSPVNVGFRENACTGYLNENNDFSPRLSESCPRIDIAKLVSLKDVCLRFLESKFSTCRIPVISGEATIGIGDECTQFIANHMHYRGCVDDFRNASDFYRNTWHLYLNRTEKLWRELHDIITLYDENSLIVDTYQY
ncbi:MAG: hypothetical protein HYT39_03570 [Candidatus Sungbacteria bacterium]|nr:hypothetical protein [Candidatus Sungbacteria bacterium]